MFSPSSFLVGRYVGGGRGVPPPPEINVFGGGITTGGVMEGGGWSVRMRRKRTKERCVLSFFLLFFEGKQWGKLGSAFKKVCWCRKREKKQFSFFNKKRESIFRRRKKSFFGYFCFVFGVCGGGG